MSHSIIGPHIVVDHHTAGIHTRTDTVIENNRDTRVYQILEMSIVNCVLRLAHDDTAYLISLELLTDGYLHTQYFKYILYTE